MISKAMQKVGNEGVITVEEAKGIETELDVVEGMQFDISNCIPSTTSSSVSIPFASSTVITPSFPTFCIALEIILPISLSPLAEIVPT